MRRRGFAGAADQAGLQQIQRVRRIAAQEPDRNIRRIFAQRIFQQIGLIELAALQIDGDIEHIGEHVQRRRWREPAARESAGRGPRVRRLCGDRGGSGSRGSRRFVVGAACSPPAARNRRGNWHVPGMD